MRFLIICMLVFIVSNFIYRIRWSSLNKKYDILLKPKRNWGSAIDVNNVKNIIAESSNDQLIKDLKFLLILRNIPNYSLLVSVVIILLIFLLSQ